MDNAKYLVGIDLGTSNCAMAYAELGQGAELTVFDFNDNAAFAAWRNCRA